MSEQQTLAQALHVAQSFIKEPAKSAEIRYSGRAFRYAELADVLAVVRAACKESDLVFYQECSSEGAVAIVTTHILHTKSDDKISSTLRLNCKSANAQDIGAGLTYAKRYSLLGLFTIAGEDDTDGPQTQARSQGSQQSYQPRPHPSPASFDEKNPQHVQMLKGKLDELGMPTRYLDAVNLLKLGHPLQTVLQKLSAK